MKILGYDFGKKQELIDENTFIDEATKEFQNVGVRLTPEEQAASRGEGWESIHQIPGVGHLSLQSFNAFYSNYIDRMYENEVMKIFTYREMAAFTEVADVIEEATNESSQVDQDDKVIHLEIIDPELAKNENIVNNLNKEFNNLFYNQFSNSQDNFQDKLWDMLRSYYIDGRVYYERVINTNDKGKGVVNMKKLPAETMDYIYNPTTGEIEVFMQYLRKSQGVQRPKTLEEANKREDVIVFYPEQIGFINYGIYGRTKQEIFGYLEKARVPYNQLKLLEISVIIYRLIRSPERLVFRIDTGNMPRDKALKYVEKIKQKLSKKQTYNPETGELTNEPEIFSMLENFYLPQSADGRGSQIETIGGNPAGFAELDDIYYFARKMYRALKYPMSRVNASQEKQDSDIMFGGSNTGEISRDEVKWAKFLERQQNKFNREFTKLFLLHMEFRGLKREYGLDMKKIRVKLNAPSNYKEQMEQNFQETRYNNYQALADRDEMSKYYLMKKFLKWDDDDIKENVEGLKKDRELGLTSSDGGY